MFKNIWSWIKTHIALKDVIYWLIIGVFILLLSISVRTCQNKNRQYNNNIKALTDTITIYQSKSGATVASKTAFESNIKELKKANSDLYKQLQDMKLKMKNVDNAVHVEGNMDFGQRDTVYVIEHDSIGRVIDFNKQFDFSNKWRTLSGEVTCNNDSLGVSILNDKVMFDYTVAMDKDNRIYIKSDNPYVTYTDLSGFTVPKPKKTHFSIGPSVGIGYGVINRKPDVYIGVTASWKLFEF